MSSKINANNSVDGVSISADSSGILELQTKGVTAITIDGSQNVTIPFKQAGTGAVARTVDAKLKEVKSVLDFGAIGDGVTDDSPAIALAAAWVTGAAAITDIPRGIIFPANYLFRMSYGVVFDFKVGTQIKTGCSIVMDSPIKPDAGVNAAITIQNIYGSYFSLWVQGGGTTGTIPDYNTADPVGCEQAFVIIGTRNCKFDITGLNYSGRVLRTKQVGGLIKQSFVDIYLKTGGQGISSIVGIGPVGQAVYVDNTGTPTGGNNAFGKFRYLASQAYYCPVFNKVGDLVIDHLEGGASATTATITSTNYFLNCTSVWLGKVLVGDETDNPQTLLTFEGCSRVVAETIFCVGADIGVLILNSLAANPGVTINNFSGAKSVSTDIVITNSYDCHINNLGSNNSVQALRITGTSSKISANLAASYLRTSALSIEDTAADVIIRGYIDNASLRTAGGYPCISITSLNSNIILDNITTTGTAASGSLSLVTANKVKIWGGTYNELPVLVTGSATNNTTLGINTTNRIFQSLNLMGSTSEDRSLSIGIGRSTNGSSYLDLVGDTTYSTYGFRIIRNSGPDAGTFLTSHGTGTLKIQTYEAGPIQLLTGLTTALTVGTNQVISFNAYGEGNLRCSSTGSIVSTPKSTGWAAATGTATRSTFVTSTVTLPILAEHVKALIDDLTTQGLLTV